MERLDAAPTPADLATSWRSLVNPFRMLTPDIEVLRDIAYSDAGRRGKLDIYRAKGQDLRDAPVLLQVHGGGWTIGDKREQGLPLMTQLAAKGWVCVAINYRLAPRSPFPAQIIDVKKAIAWVREHIADYGATRPTSPSPVGPRVVTWPRWRHSLPTSRSSSPVSRTPTPASPSPCRTTASTTSPGPPG